MKFRLGALMAIAALAIAGCGKDSGTAEGTTGTETTTTGGGGGEKMKIAVIPKGATHEFWKSVHAGADEAAAELGNIEIVWKGPMKEDDRDSQIEVVEGFISSGVKGIVLAPLDDKALAGPVKDALNADIPVVIIDSDLRDTETVSFVATDNFKGGQMAGEHLGKLLNGKGRVVLIRYQVGSASTDAREAGFLDAIKKFPEIKLVSDNQYAGATTESAQATSERVLFGLRDGAGIAVDGIYCPNESSTFGMLRVLQDNGWAGKVKFVGFDSSQKLVDGLKAGEIHGLILQNPHRMGYLGVKTLVDHINGKTVEKRIDTGATLVTKENMEQEDVAKLLAPPKG